MNRSLIQYQDGTQEWLEDSERGLEPLAEGQRIYISKAALEYTIEVKADVVLRQFNQPPYNLPPPFSFNLDPNIIQQAELL